MLSADEIGPVVLEELKSISSLVKFQKVHVQQIFLTRLLWRKWRTGARQKCVAQMIKPMLLPNLV